MVLKLVKITAALYLLHGAPTATPTQYAKRATPSGTVKKVLALDFPDPAVIQDGSTWYAFATTGKSHHIQLATSPDFDKWSLKPGHDALPKPGPWVHEKSPSVWAPHVVKNAAGDFVMYYSARDKTSAAQHCVGVATSKSVLGPYDPQPQPFACDTARGGAIDASGFTDADGSRYVVYKVDSNSLGHGGSCLNTVAPIVPTPLMLQKVGPDGFTKVGAAVQILDRSHAAGPLVEAPNLVRSADGKYVLFFSSNCFSTKWYDISYAIADKVEGPYVKAGPFAVTGTAGLYSPGGASVTPDGTRMVFHAGKVGHRQMYTARIRIDTGMRTISF